MGKKRQPETRDTKNTQSEHASPSTTELSLRLGEDCKYEKELRWKSNWSNCMSGCGTRGCGSWPCSKAAMPLEKAAPLNGSRKA